MDERTKKINCIGLIGGMGPYASAYFYRLLLDKSGRNYGAANNDEYPEVIIDSVPVPDFISDTDRLPEAKAMLINRVRKLSDYGCGTIGIVCNTGHVLFSNLFNASGGRMVSMIDLVAQRVREMGLHQLGVLATPTTIQAGLYQESLSKFGVEVIVPNEDFQERLEVIVRELVAGKQSDSQRDFIERMTDELVEENTLDGIVLGCTELPLIFPQNRFKGVVDCMDVLADELLSRYYNDRL